MLNWLITSSGGTGFVNQDYGPGGDRRPGGLLGTIMAWVQRTCSFASTTPPFQAIWRHVPASNPTRTCKIGMEFSRPGFAPFFLLFIPRTSVDRPRWRSFRVGWRWDANWGNAHSPDHAAFMKKGRLPGGYILDVIIKSRIDNLVE